MPSKFVDSAGAAAQMGRFLDLSVATRRGFIGILDSTYTCRGGEMGHIVRWLADFSVLGVRGNSDTAEATVELTTVADQIEGDHGAYDARIIVRTDTAHWTLVRSDSTGGVWMVCADSKEQFKVIMEGAPRWPPGQSYERALAMVDSVRRARGLAVIR